MTPQRSEAPRANLPSAGLAACVLGLVLCPFAYIAIGALRRFAPAFALVTLPPLVASAAYLLFRFLSKPAQSPSRALHVFAEVVSWVLIVAFLVLVSEFTLVTTFERIGFTAALFLVATLVSLPYVLLRKTALQERLKRLPHTTATLVLLTVLLLAAAVTVVYLLQPPAFIGGS
jgi:hypothetical protein